MKYRIRFKTNDTTIEWEIDGTEKDAIESSDLFINHYVNYLDIKYGRMGFTRRLLNNLRGR